MIEVAITSDGASSNFSPVCYSSSENIFVSLGEESLDPGPGELMLVTWFLDKQDDVFNLGNLILLLAEDSETMSGVFLSPERAKERKSYFPLSNLMTDRDFRIDFFSTFVLESQENVVGGESDSQRHSQD